MARPFLRIFGHLRADGEFEPAPGWETTRIARRCHPDPEFSLQLLDDAGVVVAKGAVERRKGFCDDQAMCSASRERLSGHIVLHPRGTTLVLSRDQEVIHKTPICAEKPRIHSLRVTARGNDDWMVQWEAEHPLPLSFNLAFVDPLRRIVPVARNLGDMTYALDTRRLPGGGACSVALLATDGVRSACARSDAFHLPPRAPNLYVLAPADGEMVMPDQPFSLLGRAHDLAGRVLPDAGLVWSIDGEVVARGTALALGGPLPPGEHAIEMAYVEGGEAVSNVRRIVSVPPRTPDQNNWLRIRRLIAISD
jgi:hypothetical protein